MNEQTQDRAVVLAVVVGLITVAVIGLCGVVWLVHDKIDASAVAVVTALVGPAIGALAALLAKTSTSAPVQAAAEAVGYQKAVADVAALAPAAVAEAPAIAAAIAPGPHPTV